MTTAPLGNVLSRLGQVRKSGNSYAAHCPAHEDRSPSLSVTEGDDGKVLLHCHAGCQLDDVLHALDLDRSDLYPTEPAAPAKTKPRIVETYPYVDEAGELLFEAVRFEPKDFRQRTLDGNGDWSWSLNAVRRVLYRLPEVMKAVANGDTVYIVEGEKDVHAVERAGAVATCCPMGAGKWRPEYADTLAGATVTVVADRDEPGYRHAGTVWESLEAVGCRVEIVEAKVGKDAADHLGAGYTLDALVPIEASTVDETQGRINEESLGPSDRPTVRMNEGNESIPPDGISSNDSFIRTPARERPEPQLDPTSLHGLPGRIVRALTPTTEADPVGLLLTLLAAFGNAIATGGGPYVPVGGARHHARLFVLLIGATAKARKGTSWSDTSPLLKAADPDWRRSRVVSGLSTGEGLIYHVRDSVEHEDNKVEAGVDDKRLFALEEEFSRVLASIRREGSTLSAVLRSAWDGARLQTLTKNSPMTATGAHLSVVAHVTEEELLAKLTEVDMANGLANRFICAKVRRQHLLPEGGYLDDAAVEAFGNEIRSALDLARRRSPEIRRTDAGARRWRDLYQEMAVDDPGGMLGAITARAEAQVLRLSLVYALLDSATAIDVDHLDAAWALWRYSHDTVKAVFGDSLGDDTADRLLTALRQAGGEGLDSTGQFDLFGRNITAGRLMRAREQLEARGLIVTRTVTTGAAGRPRIVSHAISTNGQQR